MFTESKFVRKIWICVLDLAIKWTLKCVSFEQNQSKFCITSHVSMACTAYHLNPYTWQKLLDILVCVMHTSVSKALHKCDAISTFGKGGNVTCLAGRELHGREDKIKFNAKVPHADGTI